MPIPWRAFAAAYLGWVLDAFDFTILTFLLVDIQRSFTVSKALAGALGSITLICRVLGGMGSGTAADRWGRKPPLLLKPGDVAEVEIERVGVLRNPVVAEA